MKCLIILRRDFLLDKQREKARLEAEMKLMVTMRQLIPAGEAKPVAPLGVILGQYYLNLADFCKDFNSKTQLWEPGILLPTKVNKGLRAKEYKLTIMPPAISFLIENCYDGDEIIDIVLVYDIVRLRAKLINKPQHVVAKMVLSTLLSFNIFKIK